MPNDPAVQAALDARAAHKAPQRFAAEPSTPSAFATLDGEERSPDDECDQGPQFDAPGHPGARYTWGGR